MYLGRSRVTPHCTARARDAGQRVAAFFFHFHAISTHSNEYLHVALTCRPIIRRCLLLSTAIQLIYSPLASLLLVT